MMFKIIIFILFVFFMNVLTVLAGTGKIEVSSITTQGSKIYVTNDLDLNSNNISNAHTVSLSTISAQDSNGLWVTDDSGQGIFVEDGGNVGIGTTNPSQDISILTDNEFGGIQILSSLDATDAISLIHANNGASLGYYPYFSMYESGDSTIVLNGGAGKHSFFKNGSLSIGTVDATYKFQVRVDGSNEGHVAADGNWARSSDLRLKNNISPLTNCLSKIMNIKAVRHDFKAGEKSPKGKGKYIGFIAQNLEKEYPEFVDTANDDNRYKSVSYGAITPVLLEGIKELNRKIKKLNRKIEKLEKQIKK